MIEIDEESKRILQEALAPFSDQQGAVRVICQCILYAYDPEFIHKRPRKIHCTLNAEEREQLSAGNIDVLIEKYSLNPDDVESADIRDITITPA